MLSSERVHRIVAYAFHGEPPTIQHVVDHIDTNRQNNRPENLRWVTKLENVLNNPITKARIELVCGSIEAFLKNPSILQGHEKVDRNFSWMKTVSLEEAKASYTNLQNWAKNRSKPQGGKMGEWILQEKENFSSKPYTSMISKKTEIIDTIITEDYFKTQSLTPNAMQIKWNTPSEFPCCPQSWDKNPLELYKLNLYEDAVFCRNNLYSSLVVDFALVDSDQKLIVMTRSADENAIKPWALAGVTFKDGIFYHANMGSFFSEDGAIKEFIIAKGEEWTGGEVFDDYC